MRDTTTAWRRDLSVDQQLALQTAGTRLADEFADVYGAETITSYRLK
jgi:arsenate reductase